MAFAVENVPVFYPNPNISLLNAKNSSTPLVSPIKLLVCRGCNTKQRCHTAVDAVCILKQNGYDCNLTIVGGTYDKKYLKEIKLTIEKKNLPVTFLGQIPMIKF